MRDATEAIDGSESPDSADAHPGVQLVFVTSVTSTGAFGGIGAADARCQELAVRARLDGVWLALLSDGTGDARTRIPIRGEVRDVAGALIASDAADFWDGEHFAPIQRDEFGVTVTTDRLVYTGTDANGTRNAMNCRNWTSTDESSQVGFAHQRDARWVAVYEPGTAAISACHEPCRWYCLRQ